MSTQANLIKTAIARDVATAIARARESDQLTHKGLRGTAREIFVQDMLGKHLPADCGLGFGTVIDRLGAQSSETDVILFNKAILPPYLLDDSAFGHFPVECCIYTFEVKSTLTIKEIRDAASKAKRLHQLDNMFHARFGPPSSFPITVLFSFRSNSKGDAASEFQRFRQVVDEAGPSKFGIPLIRVLCVVGKGYWYYAQREGRTGWWFSETSGTNKEVLDLIGGILNTASVEGPKRQALGFGNYLIEAGTHVPVDYSG